MQVPQSQSEQTQQHLQIIYSFYSTYTDNDSLTISGSAMAKLISEARIPVPKKTGYETKLLSKGIEGRKNTRHQDTGNSSNTINHDYFTLFLKNLTIIAQQSQMSLDALIQRHLEPLYLQIINNTPFGKQVSKASLLKIDQSCYDILFPVVQPLYDIYQWYFNDAIANQLQLNHTSILKRLLTFGQQYQIIPTLTKKNICAVIYRLVEQAEAANSYMAHLNRQVRGHSNFLFNRFLEWLVLLSFSVESKLPANSNGPLVALLARMSVSKGFRQLGKVKKTKSILLNVISPSKLSVATPNKMTSHQLNILLCLFNMGNTMFKDAITATQLKNYFIAILPSNYQQIVNKAINGQKHFLSPLIVDSIIHQLARQTHLTVANIYEKFGDLINAKITPIQVDNEDACLQVLSQAQQYVQQLYSIFQTNEGFTISSLFQLCFHIKALPHFTNMSCLIRLCAIFGFEPIGADMFKKAVMLLPQDKPTMKTVEYFLSLVELSDLHHRIVERRPKSDNWVWMVERIRSPVDTD